MTVKQLIFARAAKRKNRRPPMPDAITATRTNYHQFCVEPDLTYAEWCAVSEARALAHTDARFRAFVDQATAAELAAIDALPQAADSTWRDMVTGADAYRRLMRAQVRALGAWEEKK
jgi:hypothetical protein